MYYLKRLPDREPLAINLSAAPEGCCRRTHNQMSSMNWTRPSAAWRPPLPRSRTCCVQQPLSRTAGTVARPIWRACGRQLETWKNLTGLSLVRSGMPSPTLRPRRSTSDSWYRGTDARQLKTDGRTFNPKDGGRKCGRLNCIPLLNCSPI